jgi:hypothetical protein
MKILYVGTDRDEAQAIATAMSRLGEGITVSWTATLDPVVNWLAVNHDLRALVVDARPEAQLWRSVLTYAATLPSALPVVVIGPEGAGSQGQTPALDDHLCIARSQSLLSELPVGIMRAVDRARERQRSQDVQRLERLENLGELERAARADLERKLAQAAATREMVDEQFREATTEIDRLRRRHASAAADAERLARREAELSTLFDASAAMRGVLERQLADAEAARRAVEVRTARERRTAAEQLLAARQELESKAAHLAELVTRESELTGRLEDERVTRGTLEQAVARLIEREATLSSDLSAAQTARTEAQQRHEAALAAAAGELADRQARFDEERAGAEVERAGLAAQLRAVEEARDAARREHLSAAADVTRLTEREAALVGRLTEEQAARAAAAGELADRQARFDEERAGAEAERAGLAARLRAVEEARDAARREHLSAVADVTRLTEREAELAARLEDERATRGALEQAVARLIEREAALASDLSAAQADRTEAQRQHDAAMATAAADLTDRQARFDLERAQAEAERARLAEQLEELAAQLEELAARRQAMEEARDQARREHQASVAEVIRLTGRAQELEAQLEEDRAQRDLLRQALADAAAALHDAQQRHDAALAAAAADLAGREALFERERTRADAERAALVERLQAVEADRDATGRDHRSAVAEIARLMEREAQLASELGHVQALQRTLEVALSEAERAGSAAAERAAVDREAAAARQADLEDRLTEANGKINALRAAALVAEARFTDQFDEQRRQHESRLAEAQATSDTLTRERAALHETLQHLTGEHARTLAARQSEIEQLRAALQQSQADNHRLFQHAPLPMFRCTKDGVLTQANRMLTTLVGRRSADELRGADFAATVFESPNDLSWLIGRCLGSRGKESAETTWRRKDGSRLLVRLSASASAADLIECGVEDLTPVRALQDRLSQAHRMEAVGRLAAEVGVTCGNLLTGIHQNVQQWLTSDGSHPASRQRGEMLLEEVSRAAGLLRQLAAYGAEESRRPAVVELSSVVRDIAPVLKRVAGDAVEVQLPAASAPLKVDAGAERVQRLLVNLAAFGRGRMPLGGRLKIELGTIVVDRHFAAKHPNVRLGPHALVTVTESRRTTPSDGLLPLHERGAGNGAPGSAALQTKVDLGTLQELVGECGGHLWMTVQPLGEMVVKIRLPLLTSYGQPPRRTLASRTADGRARTLARLFQH